MGGAALLEDHFVRLEVLDQHSAKQLATLFNLEPVEGYCALQQCRDAVDYGGGADNFLSIFNRPRLLEPEA